MRGSFLLFFSLSDAHSAAFASGFYDARAGEFTSSRKKKENGPKSWSAQASLRIATKLAVKSKKEKEKENHRDIYIYISMRIYIEM